MKGDEFICPIHKQRIFSVCFLLALQSVLIAGHFLLLHLRQSSLQILSHISGDTAVDDVIDIGLLDFGQALEMLEQELFAFRSQAWNTIQFGTETVLTSNLTVEGDGETVNLILDSLEEEEFLRIAGEVYDL